MEVEEAVPPAQTPDKSMDDAPPNDDNNGLKRKEAPKESEEEGEIQSNSPKRARHDEASAEEKAERRQAAKQEERKRGQRLFGGLMSTLSQKPSSLQQKRREEIEKRQKEKMQKQAAEDDVKRSARLADLKKVRQTEQIVFQEEVMRHRHAKQLALARFLKTRSYPPVYYLPWKCTNEQEDIIDDQIADVKSRIRHEESAFEAQRSRHIERFGPPVGRARSISPYGRRYRSPSRSKSRSRSYSRSRSRSSSRTPEREKTDEPMETEKEAAHESALEAPDNESQMHIDDQVEAKEQALEPVPVAVDAHDESADIMEEGDEDTVIY